MLEAHFRQNCPRATLEHVASLLDNEHLIAWFIHHDSMLIRIDGHLSSHPKLVSLPLGTQFMLSEEWAEVAVSRLRARDPRATPLIARDNGMGVRRFTTRQLASRLPSLSLGSSHKRGERQYIADLVAARTIAAPPGYGSDTYRPYEALACGAIPIVLRGDSMMAAWRTLPMLIVRDYSEVNASVLELAAERAANLVMQNRGDSLLLPLTTAFWAQVIRDAADSGSAMATRPRWPTGGVALELPGNGVRGYDFEAVGGRRLCCTASDACRCGFLGSSDRPCCHGSSVS